MTKPFDERCPEGQCDWKRIAVQEQYGLRSETWECRNCRVVRHRTGPAHRTLGDYHYRSD